VNQIFFAHHLFSFYSCSGSLSFEFVLFLVSLALYAQGLSFSAKEVLCFGVCALFPCVLFDELFLFNEYCLTIDNIDIVSQALTKPTFLHEVIEDGRFRVEDALLLSLISLLQCIKV
jgi:hypothetical protein